LRLSCDQPRFGVIGTKRASLFGSSVLASLLRNTLSSRSTNISANMTGLLMVHSTDGISQVSGTEVQAWRQSAETDVIQITDLAVVGR
jgi:hypothetical protein